MKLVQFTRKSGASVWVNPEHVSALGADQISGTWLVVANFDADLEVSEAVEDVVAALTGQAEAVAS